MADVKKINGYHIKDELARENNGQANIPSELTETLNQLSQTVSSLSGDVDTLKTDMESAVSTNNEQNNELVNILVNLQSINEALANDTSIKGYDFDNLITLEANTNKYNAGCYVVPDDGVLRIYTNDGELGKETDPIGVNVYVRNGRNENNMIQKECLTQITGFIKLEDDGTTLKRYGVCELVPVYKGQEVHLTKINALVEPLYSLEFIPYLT